MEVNYADYHGYTYDYNSDINHGNDGNYDHRNDGSYPLNRVYDYCVQNRLPFDPMQTELPAEDSVPHYHRDYGDYDRQDEHFNYPPQERRATPSYTNYVDGRQTNVVAPSNVPHNDGYPGSQGYQQLEFRRARENSVPAHQYGSSSVELINRSRTPEISRSRSFQANHRYETRHENTGYESPRYEGADYDSAGPSHYTRYRWT